MKRIIISVFTIIVVAVTVGCNERKITCTEERRDSGGATNMTIEGKLKGNNVISVNAEVKFTFYNQEDANEAYKSLDDSDVFEYNLEGKVLTGKYTEDLDEPVSKKDFIKETEAEGYTCK